MTWIARFLKSTPGLLSITAALTILSVLPPLWFGLRNESLIASGAQAVTAVLVLIALPLLIVTRIFRHDARDYGWRLPEKGSRPIASTLLVLVPLVALMLAVAGLPEFREYYGRGESFTLVSFIVAFLTLGIYYAGEEFLYRGFLLMPLWRAHRYAGVAMSLMLFTLFHLGKPPLELALAVLVGALLCWLSLRTKSFIPAAVVHLAIALALNVLVAV